MFNFFKKKRIPQWTTLLNATTKSMEEKNYENVIKFASETVEEIKAKAPKQLKHLAWVYFLWGRASLNLQKFAQAEMPLFQSYQIFQELDSTDEWEMEVSLKLALGQFFLFTKKYGEAKEIFQEMESELTKSAPAPLYLKIFMHLAEANEKLRDYKTAITYFEKYLEVLAPIFGKEKSNYHGVSQHKSKLKAALEAKEKGFPDMFISVKFENGGSSAMDSQFAAWMISELPDPNQESLNKALKGVTNIELVKHSFLEDEELGEGKLKQVTETLYKVENEEEINLLIDKLELNTERNIGHMMSNADFCLKFYRNNREEVIIDFFSASMIRWRKGWKDDGQLRNNDFWEKWFERHNVDFNS